MPTPRKNKPIKKTRKKNAANVEVTKNMTKGSSAVAVEEKVIPEFYKVELQPTSLPQPKLQPQSQMADEQKQISERPNAKKVYLGILVIIFLALSGYTFLNLRKPAENIFVNKETKKIIVDQVYVPQTNKVNMMDGRLTERASAVVAVPINPESTGEQYVVSQAKLTLKQNYDLALAEVIKWSSDSKLAFIKSLGTVTPEGKSTEWQTVFYSPIKNKSYEIIVWEDKIHSAKEIDSILTVGELPRNWFDSSGAVQSLRSMPQFASGTISAINFVYNKDSNDWIYGLQTSVGGTVLHVQ